ncbi:MAG: hypothetical protein GX803_06210 [Lentisphaerae bacterium]|nr:hypothetical protein [Lentisphaerota bacterium]
MSCCARQMAAAAVLGAVLAAPGARGQQMEGSMMEGFRLPEYDAQGQLVQEVRGKTAQFMADGIILLTDVEIEFYKDGQPSVLGATAECALDRTGQRAASRAPIRIVTEKAVLSGTGFAWSGTNKQVQILSNAKLTLDSRMESGLLTPKTTESEAEAEPASEDEP